MDRPLFSQERLLMSFMLITTPSSYPALHQMSTDVTAWSQPPPPAQLEPSSPGHGLIPALRPQARVSLLPWPSLSPHCPPTHSRPASCSFPVSLQAYFVAPSTSFLRSSPQPPRGCSRTFQEEVQLVWDAKENNAHVCQCLILECHETPLR